MASYRSCKSRLPPPCLKSVSGPCWTRRSRPSRARFPVSLNLEFCCKPDRHLACLLLLSQRNLSPRRIMDTQFRNWVELYQAALLETDQERFLQLVRQAHDVLQRREQELLECNVASGEEIKAITDALRNIRVLVGDAAESSDHSPWSAPNAL